jgi:20S proteasome alpha/beta subunit
MSMYMPGATAVGVTFDGGVVFASEKPQKRPLRSLLR